MGLLVVFFARVFVMAYPTAEPLGVVNSDPNCLRTLLKCFPSLRKLILVSVPLRLCSFSAVSFSASSHGILAPLHSTFVNFAKVFLAALTFSLSAI